MQTAMGMQENGTNVGEEALKLIQIYFFLLL